MYSQSAMLSRRRLLTIVASAAVSRPALAADDSPSAVVAALYRAAAGPGGKYDDGTSVFFDPAPRKRFLSRKLQADLATMIKRTPKQIRAGDNITTRSFEDESSASLYRKFTYSVKASDTFTTWELIRDVCRRYPEFVVACKQYGFPYDDDNGQSSDISVTNPQYMVVAIGW